MELHRARVAFVGAGWFAQHHLQGWADIGAQVVGIADLDAGKGQALAERFGVARAFGDAAAMVESERPDLVDLVLPPNAQRPVLAAMLERDLPVICQKPFGRDLADAEAMATLAARRAVPLVVHENFRFAPWFRELRRLIDAGLLGRLHNASFRLRPGDGQGPGAYLERQPSFREMPQFLVRETAIHFIDTFRFLLGEVQAVSARLRRLNPAIAGEDAGHLLLEFADDRTALFDGNRLNDHVAADPRRTMGEAWLEGDAGVMRLDGDARLWWKPHRGPEREHAYAAGRADRAFGGACAALQAHVLAHLRHGLPLENTAADYLPNLHVQAAVYHAHATGRRIEMAGFDPHQPAPF